VPPFVLWTQKEWKERGKEAQEIKDNMLGWDITDYGQGDFSKIGLLLITLRNGNQKDSKTYPKPYAEKLMVVRENQITPMHFHWSKMEDIINRGGGDLEVTLYNSTEADFQDVEGGRAGKKGQFAETDVTVTMDGKKVTVPAGGKVICKPGSSITLMPGQYHSWQGVPGTGDVMLFEVSTTNDDTIDNRFHTEGERIPTMEEDEEARYLMFADYPKYTPFEFIKK